MPVKDFLRNPLRIAATATTLPLVPDPNRVCWRCEQVFRADHDEPCPRCGRRDMVDPFGAHGQCGCDHGRVSVGRDEYGFPVDAICARCHGTGLTTPSDERKVVP